jgi:hypothetical protein
MRLISMGRLVTLLLIVVLLTAACQQLGIDALATPPANNAPPASQYLPNLPGYTSLGFQRIQDFIAGLGEVGSTMTGQFGATAAIAVIDRVADCYQDIGAIAASAYTKDDLPIVAGVVAVANRTLLTDPRTFLACISSAQQPQALDGQGGGGMTPCAAAYTQEIQGSTFDFIYAGTDLEICQQFCRSLPGCTAHP